MTRPVAEPPELWTFLASNVVVLLFGSILTVVSYITYYRNDREHFRCAAAGFGLVTLGGLSELIYQLGVKGSYWLGGRELLAVQSVEGLLIGFGLATLFYSIYSYSPRQPDLTEWEDVSDVQSDTD